MVIYYNKRKEKKWVEKLFYKIYDVNQNFFDKIKYFYKSMFKVKNDFYYVQVIFIFYKIKSYYRICRKIIKIYS